MKQKTILADPYPFIFSHDAIALMVIDMQRDFLEPGGFGASLGNDVNLLQGAIPGISSLLEVFREANLPIIHTRECHKPDLSDCPAAKLERGRPERRIGDSGPLGRILIAGEPGAEIIADLKPLTGEIIIDKPGKGAFYSTDLAQTLARLGIRQLVFTGVTTEVCVQTTMREANDRGFDCLLVSDATESYFPEFKKTTLEMVRAQNAIVGWTAQATQVREAINA